MNCPKCATTALEPRVTPEGVHVDQCRGCRGMWLDEGEVLEFTSRREEVTKLLAQGFALTVPTSRSCPRCGKKMAQGRMGAGKLLLDTCMACRGLWLDDDELHALLKALG